MSFILDSLKRAEQERRQGQSGAGDPFYEENPSPAEPPKSRRLWWTALIATNLAVAVLLAVILLQRQTPPPAADPPSKPVEQATAGVAAPPPVAPPTANRQPAAPPPAEPPAPPEVPERPATQAALRPEAPRTEETPHEEVHFGPPVAAQAEDSQSEALADEPEMPASATPGSTVSQASGLAGPLPDREPSVPKATPPQSAPAFETEIIAPPRQDHTSPPPDTPETMAWIQTPQPNPVKTPPVPPKPATVAEAPRQLRPLEATAQPALSAAADSPSPPAEDADQVPLLKEATSDVRQKLGHIKISVLLYNEQQAACLVYIDSRRYRPGDRLQPEGYLIERVDPDGIILDYGEGKVKLRSGY
jgi:hypothetical protein